MNEPRSTDSRVFLTGCRNEPKCVDDNNEPCIDVICLEGQCLDISACNDGNPCTLDQCIVDPDDPGSHSCEYIAQGDGTRESVSCEDEGDPCTKDVCDHGQCTHPPGNDGAACATDWNPCTDDFCDGGSCTHAPWNEGGSCLDDDNPCTEDMCLVGVCWHFDMTCPDDGDPCTDDVCVDGVCSTSEHCSEQDCCEDGTCCPTACELCLDRGPLSPGIISAGADPVCVGDTITFTVSGVTDPGGVKQVLCYAKEPIDPGTISYTWQITKPDGSNVPDSGSSATVLADQPGTHSATVTATTSRECAPSPLVMGPKTVDAPTTATLSLEPSFIPASTAWPGMPDVSHSVITVTWTPPECEGTLEIVEVVGDGGYVPPGNGNLTATSPTEWRYDAFGEPVTALCAKPVTVVIAAMRNGIELVRRNILVLPVHTWLVTPHADGPGTPTQPPDVNDFYNDYYYLRWKYAAVLATTGGAFDSVAIIPGVCVPCGGTCAYACTNPGLIPGSWNVEFGTSAFTSSENQAASIIGHELVHTTGTWPIATSECAAYTWEFNNDTGTGIFQCDTSYLAEMVRHLNCKCSGICP